MIEYYRIEFLKGFYTTIETSVMIEDIKEFIISGKSYIVGNFKSIKEANDFINKNKNNLTYIRIEKFNEGITEYYLKNNELHRIEGPAYIKRKHFNYGDYIFHEYYFINGQKYTKEE
ncbi:MAG: hypothetical protein HPY57_15140 [Ignavibacteria bacterium]|nr:hypothetical protein [Ignavibacteria bacterium]